MSEGQLKKRILKAGNWVQGGIIDRVPIHGDWWATNQKDTLIAVDEAKKDMTIKKCYYLINELNEKFICIPVKDWEKWFGDST